MGKGASQSRSADQRGLRRRRGERAFLFDKGLSRCLAEFEREEWEWALSSCGGDTVLAARQCGLGGAPPGTKLCGDDRPREPLAPTGDGRSGEGASDEMRIARDVAHI